MLLRGLKALLAMTLLIGVLTVTLSGRGVGAAASVPTPQAVSTPQCTFNGSSLPLVTGVSNGSKIAISCTGMPALHPYLVVGTSLLLAIDPAAKPLLTGQLTSVATLNALLPTLKELDLASASLPVSDLSGNLSLNCDSTDLSTPGSECGVPSVAEGVQLRNDRLRSGDD